MRAADVVEMLETPFEELEAFTPEAWRALRRDIRSGAVILADRAAQWVLGVYYDLQQFRISAGNRNWASEERGLPAEFMRLLRGDLLRLETSIKGILDAYAQSTPWGRWATSLPGFGPIIGAGLSAFVDPEKFSTVGKVWKFFGLVPGLQWGKGQKRPFSLRAKVLAFHIAESIIRQPKSPYRPLFDQRKALEWQRNLAGELADQARARLEARGAGDVQRHWYQGRVDPEWARQVLQSGRQFPQEPQLLPEGQQGIPMLPPGHIHARARRWVAKLVLSHFWEIRYWYTRGERAPLPWVIAHGGHVDYLPPPNAPWEVGA